MEYTEYTFDYPLFMLLNFDGGPMMDAAMTAVSGVAMWIPMYVLMLWLVWRQYGWRGAVLFVAAAGVAMGVSDIFCGIFKHAGPLKHLWESFPPRWRPMYTPALEGWDITPDSMMVWRRAAAAGQEVSDTAVHVVGCGSRFGTVSSHAATIVSVTVLSCCAIRQRWFRWMMAVAAVAICYSRIYLAYHFPGDLALGAAAGCAAGLICWRMFRLAYDAAMRRKERRE